jgi:hypothetical protein
VSADLCYVGSQMTSLTQRILPVLLAAVPAAVSAVQPVPVPSAYQGLYASVQADLNSFSQTIQSNWNGVRSPVIYSAQLLSASSENGTVILLPAYNAGVQTELQELQALGVKAVSVNINFPALYAPFYADQTQYQQMLAFYTNLASEVHGRGLKLIVESHMADASPTAGSQSQTGYAQSLSWSAFVAGRAQMAATVAQSIKPDYLSVLSEPDTDAASSGKPQVDTVAGSVQMLTAILTAIHATGVTGVAVGAGAGTWQSSFLSFINADAALPLDFLDVHIYPVNRNFLPNALSAADIAHKAGKQIGMTEAWLYKESDSELGVVSQNTVEVRNNWSFWAPLDSQFQQVMSAMANYKQFAFIAPFWTNYFAAYLPYSSGQTVLQGQEAGITAMNQGAFTATAAAFENSILPAPDTTAPQVPAPPAFSVGLASLHVFWQATTDNVGVAGYHLYRNGQLAATTALTSFDDSGATKGVSYSYTVSAFDAAGNVSAQSAPAQAPKPY